MEFKKGSLEKVFYGGSIRPVQKKTALAPSSVLTERAKLNYRYRHEFKRKTYLNQTLVVAYFM